MKTVKAERKGFLTVTAITFQGATDYRVELQASPAFLDEQKWPTNDDRRGLEGLSFAFYVRPGSTPTSGKVEYRERHYIDGNDLPAMARTLASVERKIQKVSSDLGIYSVDTLAQLFAITLRLRIVVKAGHFGVGVPRSLVDGFFGASYTNDAPALTLEPTDVALFVRRIVEGLSKEAAA